MLSSLVSAADHDWPTTKGKTYTDLTTHKNRAGKHIRHLRELQTNANSVKNPVDFQPDWRNFGHFLQSRSAFRICCLPIRGKR